MYIHYLGVKQSLIEFKAYTVPRKKTPFFIVGTERALNKLKFLKTKSVVKTARLGSYP